MTDFKVALEGCTISSVVWCDADIFEVQLDNGNRFNVVASYDLGLVYELIEREQ